VSRSNGRKLLTGGRTPLVGIAEPRPYDAKPRRVKSDRLLVLDHHMPEMTGLEMAERLRADGACLPTLLVTGSPSPAIVARAFELGIARVLEKPSSDEDLLEFINATRL
jgi:CheY-like chemotaxis protein